MWWTGRNTQGGYGNLMPEEFTLDANDACRFARKEDAERVRALMTERGLPYIVTEHGWATTTPTAAPQIRREEVRPPSKGVLLERLRAANDLLRSADEIAKREMGQKCSLTNWAAFTNQVSAELEREHTILRPPVAAPSSEPTCRFAECRCKHPERVHYDRYDDPDSPNVATHTACEVCEGRDLADALASPRDVVAPTADEPQNEMCVCMEHKSRHCYVSGGLYGHGIGGRTGCALIHDHSFSPQGPRIGIQPAADEDERAFEEEFTRYCTALTRPKYTETHREFARRIARHFWLARRTAQQSAPFDGRYTLGQIDRAVFDVTGLGVQVIAKINARIIEGGSQ